MRCILKIAAAGLAGAVMTGAAAAAPVTFNFQNPSAETPVGGNYTTGGTCNGVSVSSADRCTIDHAAGLGFSKSWANLNVTAKSDGGPTALLQDLWPFNSGLAALSVGESSSDDQVQSSRKESLVFDFGGLVFLTGMDFNAGADTNCATPGKEGPCGTFNLIVDGVLTLANTNLTALDNMVFANIAGQVFEIVATGPNDGGFTVGSVSVAQVPLPGAAALMLAGIAGLGFGARRKRSA